MNIQVLVSTMYQTDYELLKEMNIQTDAVVINQCDSESRKSFLFRDKHILWINTTERGLSKSRNYALREATGDICMLADDDMIYEDGFYEPVLAVFEKNANMSVVRFRLTGIEVPYKSYSTKACGMGYLRSMKTSSVEVAFRLKHIKKEEIWFNERIGAGTRFKMGEENVFLFQCLRSGLKMMFAPVTIARLHLGNSSWFDGYNEGYFISLGAEYAAMETKFTSLFMLQFIIRKRKLYLKTISIKDAFKNMKMGQKLYLQERNQK